VSEGPAGWARPLHEHVLDATGIGPATSLLDLGCGAGAFARAAAERGARVSGIDLDPAAVAAACAAVPEGSFAAGDAGRPAFADDTFDVVTAIQLITHVPEPLRVLRAARRVAVSRGAVAVTVWGREHECDVRAFGEALAPWLPPRRSAPEPPAATDPRRLRELAGLAGLEVIGLDEVICPFDYPDADAVVGPLLASRLGRAVIRRVHPAVVREAVLDRLEPMRTATGYRLDNLFRVLVSRA